MAFNIHTLYHHLFNIWRSRRFKQFLLLIKPTAMDILIDVGGYPWCWTSQPLAVKRIDTVNPHEVPWSSQQAPNQNINVLLGDGCQLGFPDKSYDIGYSNSVIEHVGSWERQQQFAAEIRRVAKRLWVQTPAYECPIEPHYLAPFVHYLPRSFQKSLVRWFTVRGWVAKLSQDQINAMVDTTRLLRKWEMRQLFPDCEITTERMLWIFPKSYIAVRKDGFLAEAPQSAPLRRA